MIGARAHYDDLTRVELTWVEKKIEFWIRWACRKPCSRLRLPRERWHFHALLTF